MEKKGVFTQKMVTFSFDDVENNCEEDMKNHLNLVKSIYEVNSNNILEVKKLIEDSEDSFYYIINVINYGFIIRPHKTKLFLSLLISIVKNNADASSYLSKLFYYYLDYYNVIKKYYELKENASNELTAKDFPPESIQSLIVELAGFVPNETIMKEINLFFGLYPEDSIEYAIKNDDIESFVRFSNENDFDPKQKFEVCCISYNSSIVKKKVSYLQLMALYGSVKCFKTAFINNDYNKENLEEFAIAGGNNEIIRILEHANCKFDECFVMSTYYHHRNISEWLMRNYECNFVQYFNAVSSYNDFIFMFNITNNIYVNEESLRKTLYTAVKRGNFAIFEYLMLTYEFEVNDKNEAGFTILHISSLCCLDLFRILCEFYDADINAGDTNVLLIAAQMGQLDIVKYLVDELDMPIEQYDENGKSPLYFTLSKGFLDITDFFYERSPELFNKKDSEGETLLHYFIMDNDFKSFKLLIERYGADKFVITKERNSLVAYAALNDALSILDYLIKECKLGVNFINKEGETIIQYLMRNSNFQSAVLLIEKYGANINKRSSKGLTALGYAVVLGLFEPVKYLIEKRHAPLHNEEFFGYSLLTLCRSKLNLNIIKYLIENCGFSPNEASPDVKQTLLHSAANENKLDVVKYLVNECNANIELKDEDGLTAETIAKMSSNTEIANFLHQKHKTDLFIR